LGRPLIIGNWKMNGSLKGSEALIRSIRSAPDAQGEVDLCICPPFTLLSHVGSLLAATEIKLGAQDVYHEDSGAYTGEVSLPMLKEFGCQYVLVGHSERRQYFGENDASVAKKVAATVRHGLTPVLCVGEELATRRANRGEDYVLAQLMAGLSLLEGEVKEIAIAYEPIWAIGTGQAATPLQASSMLRAIYQLARNKVPAGQVRLLYGGSVTPENAAGFLAAEFVGGVLAGGVSLKGESFAQIASLAGSKTYV